MEKMRMESINLTEQNVEKIGAMFPNVITEAKNENGKLKKAINFGLLKQVLSDDVIDGDEAYEFKWVGKNASMVEIGKPIRKVLRPCKEESKNWDGTENIYIEGENFDAMKLILESYLGAINVIIIDPPYNTGRDFIYKDNYKLFNNEYEEQIGVFDDEKNRLFINNDSDGRIHSDWCSMIYPRLFLMQKLLSKDGIIAVAIDDHEVFNMGKMMDEIFGVSNRLACAPWLAEPSGGKEKTKIRNGHEYILIYVNGSIESLSRDEKSSGKLNLKDDFGVYRKGRELRKWGGNSRRKDRPNQWFGVTAPNGITVYPYKNDGTEGHWRWSKQNGEMIKILNDSRYAHWELCRYDIGVTVDGESERWVPFEKIRDEKKSIGWSSWLDKYGYNAEGTEELKKLFGDKIFDTPKPTSLLEWIISLYDGNGNNVLVLDAFSGSSSTAHAVMKINSVDGEKRRFIMIQSPDACDEESEAYHQGFKVISDIGKERIRRAGEAIKNGDEITAENQDIGFRVFKLDSTNMKDVYYAADEYFQGMLSGLESNIKEDRTDIDLLFGCLLEWGLPLSLSHMSEEVNGVPVHTINDGDLIACFAQNISEVVVKEIAKRQPLRAVFRDSSFANSPEKINVEEIFKLMAPNTSLKVL